MRRSKMISFPPYLICGLYFFTLGGIISSGFSQAPIASFFAFLKYFYLIAIWFWLGMLLLERPEHIKTSIILWTISAALSGTGALIQLIWGDVIPGTAPVWGRMTGFTEHVNDLGGVASVAFVPALIMVIRGNNENWQLIGMIITFLLIISGLILSVSMSGLLAVLMSISVWLFLAKSTFKNITFASVVLILIFVIANYQSKYLYLSIATRMRDIFVDGIHLTTLISRFETYSAAWDSIIKNPLVGVGIGSTSGITETGHIVHNILLSSWFEAGLFGFLGILMILFSVFLTGINLIRYSHSNQSRVIAICLFSSYIAFLTLGMSQAVYYKRFGWISAALILALFEVRKRIGGKIFSEQI